MSRREDDPLDAPPPADPVKRNPTLSLHRPPPRPHKPADPTWADGRDYREPRPERRVRAFFAARLKNLAVAVVVAAALNLAGVVAHALWLVVRFGLWL